jgi:hypothetical protein
MCLIELSSIETIGAPVPYAACPGGRTIRPWSIPGTRTLCMYVNFPLTLSGMSTLGTRVPTIV